MYKPCDGETAPQCEHERTWEGSSGTTTCAPCHMHTQRWRNTFIRHTHTHARAHIHIHAGIFVYPYRTFRECAYKQGHTMTCARAPHITRNILPTLSRGRSPKVFHGCVPSTPMGVGVHVKLGVSLHGHMCAFRMVKSRHVVRYACIL